LKTGSRACSWLGQRNLRSRAISFQHKICNRGARDSSIRCGVQGIKLATNYDKLGKLSVPLTALKAIGTACTGVSTLGERCRPQQSGFIWRTAILVHRGIRPPASPDERAFGALPPVFLLVRAMLSQTPHTPLSVGGHGVARQRAQAPPRAAGVARQPEGICRYSHGPWTALRPFY
jgi:hypothetical protein